MIEAYLLQTGFGDYPTLAINLALALAIALAIGLLVRWLLGRALRSFNARERIRSLHIFGLITLVERRRKCSRETAVARLLSQIVFLLLGSALAASVIQSLAPEFRPVVLALMLVFAVAAAVTSYVTVFFVFRGLARRTKTDVDDVLLEVLGWPLAIWLLAAVSHWAFLSHSSLETGLAYRITLIVIGFWVAWRVFSRIVLYYAEIYAERTETAADDIFLALLRQVAPILIVAGAIFMVLHEFGVDARVLAAVAGGATFVLGFALKDAIANIYSGVSLVVDAPFRLGDLVILDDGTLSRIDKIGLRMTTLYDVSNHTTIFMPNAKLAEERLTNITRPSTDLRITIEVGVDYESDPVEVRNLLEKVANAHPHVLGDPQKKKAAIAEKIDRLAEAGNWAKAIDPIKSYFRIEHERLINQRITELKRKVDGAADRVSDLEEGGFDAAEKKELRSILTELKDISRLLRRHLTTWVMLIRYERASAHQLRVAAGSEQTNTGPPDLPEELAELAELAAKHRPIGQLAARALDYRENIRKLLVPPQDLEEHRDSEESQHTEDDTAPAFIGEIPAGREESYVRDLETRITNRGFGRFPDALQDIDKQQEFARLVRKWNSRASRFDTFLRRLTRELEFGNERRLDDHFRSLSTWLEEDFWQTSPWWKYPRKPFLGFGDSSLDFGLRVYVNDVTGDRFTRRGATATDLRMAIFDEFAKAGIEIPFPQRVVSYRDIEKKDTDGDQRGNA